MARILEEEGPIRKLLRERGGCRRILANTLVQNTTISRAELSRLITDEEMAHVEYTKFAEHPAIKQHDEFWRMILSIADDEKRHGENLKRILALLEREGKIV